MLATFFSHPVVWSTSLIELLTVLGLFSIIAGMYRHYECHVSNCHWPGHAVVGTSHRACRRHHPHLHKHITAEDIAHAAKVAKERVVAEEVVAGAVSGTPTPPAPPKPPSAPTSG